MASSRVFLLSPARCDGQRARLLLEDQASFPLAIQLREADGVELGALFAFLSALYFRGKLTYARTFARAPHGVPPVLVITTDRGLLPPDARVRPEDLRRFARVDLAAGGARYLTPLRRDAEALARALPATADVVLLGSIATGKYADVLLRTFGRRLLFPIDFVGRGDMSRGGLLLRHAQARRELVYEPLAESPRRGGRPPKLERAG